MLINRKISQTEQAGVLQAGDIIPVVRPGLNLHSSVASIANFIGSYFNLKTEPTPEILTQDRTYYVRKDGSDTNTGLLNTPLGAFLTVSKAIDSLTNIVPGQFKCNIQINDGTYTEVLTSYYNLIGNSSGYSFTINGNANDISAVIIDGNIEVEYSKILIENLQINGRIHASNAAYVNVVGSRVGGEVLSESGATTYISNCELFGDKEYGFYATKCGIITESDNTVMASPTYGTAYGIADKSGVLESLNSTGPALGKRFKVATNGVINTYGAGLTSMRGDLDGLTESGGQYV